jgi:hypothetical protein
MKFANATKFQVQQEIRGSRGICSFFPNVGNPIEFDRQTGVVLFARPPTKYQSRPDDKFPDDQFPKFPDWNARIMRQ